MASNKKWSLIFSEKADREFKKLGSPVQKRIIDFFTRLIEKDDPKVSGKPLRNELSSYWSYRVGDYRVICHINQGEMVIVAVKVGHRRDVYDFRL